MLTLFLLASVRRWWSALADIVLSAVAAGLAWWLAADVVGNSQPVFAPIAAMIGLAPGIASRRRQTLGMLAGVAAGIVVGGVARQFGLPPIWAVPGATLASMLLVASIGLDAVMMIQAGASALIVVGTALPGAGFERLVDAGIGAALALVFSQLLFPADPVRAFDRAIAEVADVAGRVLASRGGERLTLLPDVLAATGRITDALALARAARTWTLAGRFRRRSIATAECERGRPGMLLAAAAIRACADDDATVEKELRARLDDVHRVLPPASRRKME